jgi:tRNA A-37 threonylcarbamoyl transferase component Bud32
MSVIKDRIKEIIVILREAHKDFSAVKSDKQLIKKWLLGARRAQIVAGICLVLGLLLVPVISDGISDIVFPEKKIHSLFRTRTKRHPASKTMSSILISLYWIAATGTSLSLLWLELPNVARRKTKVDPVSADAGMAATMLLSGVENTMIAQGSSPSNPDPSSSQSSGNSGIRYAIESELGRGGMGVVYLARDSVLGRSIALKALPPGFMRDEGLDLRFRQEARVLAQLTHAHIVQVYDLVEEGDNMLIAMELVNGRNLSEQIQETGPMTVSQALETGISMAEAMAYAHDRGVVHRDFKPQNVLINEQGQPKITDFGLAKISQSPKLTGSGAIMGSPAYMSPEQASGKSVDARSDIYSLGVTLYEMLSGRPPFEGGTADVLVKHLTEPPPSIREFAKDIPEDLEKLLDDLLVKDPEDRVPDMNTVASRMKEIKESHES